MTPRIAKATARPDLIVDIVWADGSSDAIDFAPIVATGGVMTALKDPAFFVAGLQVEPDGYGLDWRTQPAAPDQVGGIDFSAQGLWYRAHPEELARDQASAAQ